MPRHSVDVGHSLVESLLTVGERHPAARTAAIVRKWTVEPPPPVSKMMQ
jgi:hypothetical protein